MLTLVLTGDAYTQEEHTPDDVVFLYGVPFPEAVKTEKDDRRMWIRFATEEDAEVALQQLSVKKATGELGEAFKATKATRNYHKPTPEQVQRTLEKTKLYIGPIKDKAHVDDATWIPHLVPTTSA